MTAPYTLAIDIGGSGIKSLLLDGQGNPISDRLRKPTPRPAIPSAILLVIQELAIAHGQFHRLAVGFPGVIRNGITRGAINLDPSWDDFPLQRVLQDMLGVPVRLANDADVQGLGAIQGKGVELVITLGTGFGSALFVNGQLVPNLEMGQHYFRGRDTYEQRLGQAALDCVGVEVWNRRLLKAIASLQLLFNYDHLYIGGGNAKKITVPLPANVTVVSNDQGLLGSIKLWQGAINSEFGGIIKLCKAQTEP